MSPDAASAQLPTDPGPQFDTNRATASAVAPVGADAPTRAGASIVLVSRPDWQPEALLSEAGWRALHTLPSARVVEASALDDALAQARADGQVVQVVDGAYAGPGASVLEAVAVMDELRGPDGCPWVHEQTAASLGRYVTEEAAEVVEAIDAASAGDDPGAVTELVDELGDLLFQVLFQARVGAEGPDGAVPFDIDDVAAAFVTKMRRRNPHVFGSEAAARRAAGAPPLTVPEVEAQWQRIKAAEKHP